MKSDRVNWLFDSLPQVLLPVILRCSVCHSSAAFALGLVRLRLGGLVGLAALGQLLAPAADRWLHLDPTSSTPLAAFALALVNSPEFERYFVLERQLASWLRAMRLSKCVNQKNPPVSCPGLAAQILAWLWLWKCLWISNSELVLPLPGDPGQAYRIHPPISWPDSTGSIYCYSVGWFEPMRMSFEWTTSGRAVLVILKSSSKVIRISWKVEQPAFRLVLARLWITPPGLCQAFHSSHLIWLPSRPVPFHLLRRPCQPRLTGHCQIRRAEIASRPSWRARAPGSQY